MEVPQCMQLTGTNSSIELRSLSLSNAHLYPSRRYAALARGAAPGGRHIVCRRFGCSLRIRAGTVIRSMSVGASTERPDFASRFRRPGDYGGVAAPDPIPNSAVKRPCADGTSS